MRFILPLFTLFALITMTPVQAQNQEEDHGAHRKITYPGQASRGIPSRQEKESAINMSLTRVNTLHDSGKKRSTKTKFLTYAGLAAKMHGKIRHLPTHYIHARST